MAPKRATKRQHGKGVKEVLSAAKQIAKDTKIISKTLSMIPDPRAQGLSWVASQAGYGRKKKKQKGRGLFSDIGGGIGNVAMGIGGGLGSIARGLFGGGVQ